MIDDSLAHSRIRQRLGRLVWSLLPLAGFVALAWRQHRFVDRYAVNVMFGDQWDFYTPLFKHEGWWAVFSRQHGPHRQGLGFLVTEMLAEISHWNSRWDAFGTSFALIVAALLGALVAMRSGFRLGLVLVPVALMFFNPRQYEVFVGATNLSHGAVPVLLLMVFGLCWFIASPGPRLLLLGVVTFLLTFTGFGLFAALIAPCVILVEGIQALRAGERIRAVFAAAALLIIGAGWALFARGYQFAPAVPNFRFPHDRPLEYFGFVALMLANFHGTAGSVLVRVLVGLLIGAALLAMCAWHGWRLLRRGAEQERVSVVIFSFSAFALIYCANTAVGRVSLGLPTAATASRYVTLMIPGAVAILLQCKYFPSKIAVWAIASYSLALGAGTLRLSSADWDTIRWLHDGRAAWRAAYLQTNDERLANERAGFSVYPEPGAIAERLRYLEHNRLNLFVARR